MRESLPGSAPTARHRTTMGAAGAAHRLATAVCRCVRGRVRVRLRARVSACVCVRLCACVRVSACLLPCVPLSSVWPTFYTKI